MRTFGIALALLALITSIGLLALGSKQETAMGGGCTSTQITQWTSGTGHNNHYYRGVCASPGITWDDAKTAAEGLGGHLGVITTADENAFAFNLIKDPGFWSPWPENHNCREGPWLGAYQPDGSSEPGGGWTWVTNEPFSYTNWAGPHEPNNDHGNESRLMFWSSNGCSGDMSAKWNDIATSATSDSFLVEWDANPATPSPSPTPRLQGDVNCDTHVNLADFEFLLEYAAGLNDGTTGAGCPDVGGPAIAIVGTYSWGDVNCDGHVDAADALDVLLFVVQLPGLPTASGCPAVGTPLLR